MPMQANATNINAPITTNEALLGGRGWGDSMNSDATANAAKTSVKALPRMATTALAVTPTGLLMRIIYSSLTSSLQDARETFNAASSRLGTAAREYS